MTSQEQMNKTYLDIKSGNRKQYAHKETDNNIADLFCSLAQEIAFTQSFGDISGLINAFNELQDAYLKEPPTRKEINNYKQGYKSGLKRGRVKGFLDGYNVGYSKAIKNKF